MYMYVILYSKRIRTGKNWARRVKAIENRVDKKDITESPFNRWRTPMKWACWRWIAVRCRRGHRIGKWDMNPAKSWRVQKSFAGFVATYPLAASRGWLPPSPWDCFSMVRILPLWTRDETSSRWSRQNRLNSYKKLIIINRLGRQLPCWQLKY